MRLFSKKQQEPPRNAVVEYDGSVIATGHIPPSVSPVVFVYNTLYTFRDLLGVDVKSVSLRADEEGEVGLIETAQGEELHVRFTRTNRSTVVHISDGHEDVTVIVQ